MRTAHGSCESGIDATQHGARVFSRVRMTPVTRRSFCLAALLGSAAVRAQPGPSRATVRQDGSGTHATLAAALADAPAGDAPYHVEMGPGRWTEKVTVRRANVILSGADRNRTILSYGAAASHPRPGGGSWGTYGSATLTVEADGFEARDLTIENGFDYVTDMVMGQGGAQAVALALGAGVRTSRIERVALLGHQDTFYLREGRVAVRDCLIAGSVDFIFGGAEALFEDCEIRSRLRPGQALQGYVAAPSTPRAQESGFIFRDCRLTREAGVADRSVYLGRPWRAGGNLALLGATAFENCWMDAHIHPDGWSAMGYRGPDGQPMLLHPADARFFETASRGPGRGARPAGRYRGSAAPTAQQGEAEPRPRFAQRVMEG